MKNIFFITIIVLFFAACKSGPEKKVVSEHPNGKPKDVEYYEEKDGKEVLVKQELYYESGVLKYSLSIKDGKKHGLCTYYFENGEKWSEQYFENDISHGDHKLYHPNGEVSTIGQFENGKCHGTWLFYNETGEQIKEVLYEHGEILSQ